MAINYVGCNTLYQAGSGNIIGATSIVLTSFTDIYGNVLTMADFGTLGFITCEPDTNNQEFLTFTGVVANANLTYTLTGVKTALAKSLYTQTSGAVRQHSGGTKVVVSDSPAFWATFANKNNDEVLIGDWKAPSPATGTSIANKNYVDGVAIAGAPDASTTVKGVVRTTISPNKTLGTVTITIATPAVATLTAHGLTLNDTVQFTTSGALPTGITASTNYFVIAAGLTANNFEISATLGGTAINTSGGQSGTHTLIRTTPYVVSDNDVRVPTADPTTIFVTQANLIGIVTPYAGSASPTGWLLCDGSAVSRATYATLFGITSTTFGVGDGSTTFNLPDLRSRIPVGVGTGTKVATFASRASNVITVTGLTNASNNEFQTGQAVVYVTSGTVITGLTSSTTYYVIRVTNTTFSLATTLANAQNGTVIALSSDGTGTQTFTQTLTTRTRGDTGGEENHAQKIGEIAQHTHDNSIYSTAGGAITGFSGGATQTIGGYGVAGGTITGGGSLAMNVMQPFVVLNYIIKY